MYPVHDVDTILLLALSYASKRHPASLVEIFTAFELNNTPIPSSIKLIEAFARLSELDLICESNQHYGLTENAQNIILTKRNKKVDTVIRLLQIKEKLTEYEAKGTQPSIALDQQHVTTAIAEHQALVKKRGIYQATPTLDTVGKPPKTRKPFKPRRH